MDFEGFSGQNNIGKNCQQLPQPTAVSCVLVLGVLCWDIWWLLSSFSVLNSAPQVPHWYPSQARIGASGWTKPILAAWMWSHYIAWLVFSHLVLLRYVSPYSVREKCFWLRWETSRVWGNTFALGRRPWSRLREGGGAEPSYRWESASRGSSRAFCPRV